MRPGASGRAASPSAAVVDSPSVKAPAPGTVRGYDAAKTVTGRKRHIAVDTGGRRLMVNLTPADISDPAGGEIMLTPSASAGRGCLFADGAYDRLQLMDKAAGFQVLPRRWVVEAQLRLADTLAPLGARLRATSRRLRGDDPHRDGHHPSSTEGPSLNSQKDSEPQRERGLSAPAPRLSNEAPTDCRSFRPSL
ncbi:transposase [Methylobacterium sp. ID0610]|uniref:transposase n=1 Tax=Methylobacterium carpenticola TaxID=3344827 RepID=UPI00367DC4BE